jgi:hypothetical protein
MVIRFALCVYASNEAKGLQVSLPIYARRNSKYHLVGLLTELTFMIPHPKYRGYVLLFGGTLWCWYPNLWDELMQRRELNRS